MYISYLILLYISFLFTISNIANIQNFLSSYFIISAIITIPQIISNSTDIILKASNLYASIIVIGSIIGLITTSKNYKYYVFTTSLLLLFHSYVFDLNYYTNNCIFTLEIAIFILVGIFKELHKKFYFYLFIFFLSGTFINNVWLNIICQNKEILNSLKNIELYNTVSCIYLITFYVIYVIYHVKFRINQ